MKKLHLISLALLSGLLLTVSWPDRGFSLLLLVALVPLLFIEDHFYKNKTQNHPFGLFPYVFLSFLVWSTVTTWWIYNSTFIGVFFAILFCSLFLSIAFTLFHLTRRNLPQQWLGYLSLLAYWIGYEYFNHDWDLSWPWLSLGNGFASYPRFVQWYEYTGIFGGSLWIWLCNLCIFFLIKQWRQWTALTRKFLWACLGTLSLIIFPVIFSVFRYYTYEEKSRPVDVIVVQPNMDPYNEQYNLPPLEVTHRLIQLSRKQADRKVQFIVSPESAIQEYIWENDLNRSGSFDSLRNFMRSFPQVKMVVGLSSRKVFMPGEPLTSTARKFIDADEYYDAYNTAALLDTSPLIQKHHKSKLTPGVEVMPFAKYLKFMEKYALDLGGTVGSLGSDPEQIPYNIEDTLKIAPIICYESVYGEFVANYVRNGANLIFVITNDGWWGNTAGHRQHLSFSSLRAIETRRSIARSANTGTSAFINQRGDILQPTEWWKPAVIRQKINANDAITFYVKYGDYIGRACLYASGLLLLLTLAFVVKRKSKKTVTHH